MLSRVWDIRKLASISRWGARTWGTLVLVSVLLVLCLRFLNPEEPSPGVSEWLGVLLLVSVCVGLVLAWWRSGLGGIIAVVGTLAYLAWALVVRGRAPNQAFFAIVLTSGVPHILHWLVVRSSPAAPN